MIDHFLREFRCHRFHESIKIHALQISSGVEILHVVGMISRTHHVIQIRGS